MKYIKFLPFYILSILPLGCLFVVSDFMFVIIYYIIGYRRKVVRLNLKNAFPKKTEQEIIQIEKKFYQHLCDIIFEILKGLTMSKKTIAQRFRIKNIEMIEELHTREKNIILYTAHFGNWEWLGFLSLFIPYKTQTTFYQKLSNAYFNELMLLIRSRFDCICIESKQGYKTLIKLRQEKKLSITAIIGDQCPGGDASKHWVEFLNQDTAFLVGADRIAKKLNYEVIFVAFQKIKRGSYEIEFIPIENNSQLNKSEEMINQYAQCLETAIIQSPELWLWSHRRWKLDKPE